MDKQKLLYHYYCEFSQYSHFIEKNPESGFKRISSKGWDFIHSKIFEAFHTYGIELSIRDFRIDTLLYEVANPHSYYHHNYHYNHKIMNWLRSLQRRHEKPSHYTKKPHHQKKQTNEDQLHKKEWRERKGINKDNAKKNKRRRGAGRYYKK